MNPKAWYTSKTLWINVIAIVAMGAQTINASYIVSPEIQAGLLGLVNLILRAITSAPIEWSPRPSVPPLDEQGGFVRLPLLLALTIIGLFLLAGCATTTSTGAGTGSSVDTVTKADIPLQTAGKSLLAVKSTIVTAATATDALCKADRIGPDKCQQAAAAYQLAKPAYDAAVDAYLLWSLGHGDQAGFNASLSRVQSLAANLLALSDPLGPKGGAQ